MNALQPRRNIAINRDDATHSAVFRCHFPLEPQSVRSSWTLKRNQSEKSGRFREKQSWSVAATGYHRILRRILIVIVLLIVYGSLYPWHFRPVHLAASPLWILLHSWSPQPWRYLIRDVVVNVALYIPLGFAAHVAFRDIRLPGFSVYGPVLLGLLLSTAMELTQLLEPLRNTNMVDVITNVIGAGLGVIAGLLFEALAPRDNLRRIAPAPTKRFTDGGALMLAFCWISWLFFPLFPVMGRYELSRKLALFIHGPVFDAAALLSVAAAWFAACLLIAAAGARMSRGWFFLTALAVPAQLFVAERQPSAAVLVAAIAGVLLFVMWHQGSAPTMPEACFFLAVIVFRGLSPFHFVAGSTSFNWVPFGATLGGDWQSAASVLIEKAFYSGTAIWLLRASGVRLVLSVGIVGAVLLSIELAQTHLPGRTPEVTDPLLAILMGFFLAMLAGSGIPSRLTPE